MNTLRESINGMRAAVLQRLSARLGYAVSFDEVLHMVEGRTNAEVLVQIGHIANLIDPSPEARPTAPSQLPEPREQVPLGRGGQLQSPMPAIDRKPPKPSPSEFGIRGLIRQAFNFIRSLFRH